MNYDKHGGFALSHIFKRLEGKLETCLEPTAMDIFYAFWPVEGMIIQFENLLPDSFRETAEAWG